MANEIKQLECLSQISSAIIATPSYSLSSFGILKDPGTKQLTYTGNIESSAKADYAKAAAASIALTGAATIVTMSALARLGLMIAGVGVLPVPQLILLWGYKKYKQKKREQEQKERMYRELVAKLQAAINRQKEINRKLEERLRQQQASTEQLKAEIARLRQEIANLMELIEVLTQQINNFKNAA
jgi:DNA repair exonuclease SbcCD ATPase subunit